MDDTPVIQAFKQMQVPLMIVDAESRILHCNQATGRLFGYGVEELMQRDVSDVLHVASSTELNAFITPPAVDAMVKGMIGRSKSGKPVVLAVHITAWTDSERGLQHALVLRDVADEMEADRLARERLKLATSAMRGARLGAFEYNPVSNAVMVSDVWREIMELDPSENIDVQQHWRARVHPDDLDAALEPIRKCQESKSDRAGCEYRLRSRDGSHWRWMQTDVAVAGRDDAGTVVRLVGAQTDISKRKLTENAHRISVEQFRTAFENAPIGMAIVGLDGAWLQVNAALCDLFGYSEADLLRTDFQTLTHGDDLDADLEQLDRLAAGDIPSYRMEKRYIRASGAVMWGLLSVAMVRDAEDRPAHFISQIVDVTEERRLREIKSDFVSTVTHELRTPLTSVLGSLTLLSSMDAEPLSDAAQRLLFIAQQNGDRLHTLINDLLNFQKFSARQMRFTLSRQQIVGLTEDALLANLASADKFGVRFSLHCPDRSLTGFVDPERFQQVMANLLSNAAKFADGGGTVEVAIEGLQKSIKVAVSNTGAGIPEAFRDQIFRPFSQAAPTSTRKRGGTGLGLSITKQMVEQMGGEIGFTSARGQSTTFWFTIPVHDPDGSQRG